MFWWRLKKIFVRHFSGFISLRLPRIIAIEATNRCMLQCLTCPVPNIMRRAKGDMSIDTFELLLSKLDWGVERMKWVFGGEPLMNERLFDMISLARKRKITSKIDTNGMLLERYEKEVFNSGVEVLNVAFEGTTRETASAFRIGYDMDLVLKGLRKICSQKKRLRLPLPKIYLNFLVKKNNESELEEATRLAKDIGADAVTFKSLNINPGLWLSKDKMDELADEFLPLKNEALVRYKRSKGNWVKKASLPDYCTYLLDSLTVTWDGKVLPCCLDFDGTLEAGDIRQQDIKAIWRGRQFRLLRKRIYKKEVRLCQNCTPVSPMKKVYLG